MPISELIVTLPVPLPELVIVPVLLAEVVEIVMPLAVELLLLMTRLPIPVMPPLSVRTPVPLLLIAKFPLSVVVLAAPTALDPAVVSEVSAAALRLPSVKMTLLASSVALPVIDVEPKASVGAAVKLAVVGASVTLPMLSEPMV